MTAQPWRCSKCGHAGPFIIPVIPISGVKHIAECPNYGTRYQAMAAAA